MYLNILVPVNLQDSKLTDRAITVAQDIAEHYSSSITVMTVIPDFGMPMVASFFPDDAMDKAKKEVAGELERYVGERFREPASVQCRVMDGTPHKVIIAYAESHDTDLIVLPARAKDFSKVFLGSSSTHVVERAPCSVLVVRA
jgi:nucleotide-binding universal stress UspA family protein